MLPSDIRSMQEAYRNVYEQSDLLTNDLIEEIVEELIEECVEFGYDLDEAAELVEEAATEYLMELNPYAARSQT
jgi:DNA-binding transcriptional regulator YhcF (GntR family)